MRMILCALSICLTFSRTNLARAQATAETEQYADLESVGDGQQTPRLVRAHHQWDLLRLTDVIDLGCEIQSPQCHAEQEPQPGHDAVAVADAHARLGKVQLEKADVLGCGGVSGNNLIRRAESWLRPRPPARFGRNRGQRGAATAQ